MRSVTCRPVVVLAERDKDDMDKQLKKALRGQKVEWHTRSGAPHAIADLEKVAAGQARTIIVLQPDEEEVNPCLNDNTDSCSPGTLHLAYCKVPALNFTIMLGFIMSASGSTQSVAQIRLLLCGTPCYLPAVQPGDTAVKHTGALQDAGKKLVSALLGLQSTRAATQPRPFLKLQRQHLAVQVCPMAACSQTPHSYMPSTWR